MIKVLLFPNLNVNNNDNRFHEIVKIVSNKLSDKITFIAVDDTNKIPFFTDNINIIMCNHVTPEVLSLNKPIIVCSRNDSTSTSSVRKYLFNDRVVAYFKDYVFRDYTLFKPYYLYNRYHFNTINDIYNIAPSEIIQKYNKHTQLTDEHLKKIKCVTWNLFQYSNIVHPYMTLLSSTDITYDRKNIDLFMVCHDHKEHPILYKHRSCGKIIIEQISTKHTLTYCTTSLDTNLYLQTIQTAKICIAPYGLGERIALDQYGILAGCIVIKPPMDHIVSDPNIYSPEHDMFEYCKADFSDVEEIILNILNNYDDIYAKKAMERRKKLLTYDENYYATQFYANIKDVIDTLESD